MKKQTSEVISRESLVNELKRVLNLGLDVHYRQVTVAMQEDGGRIKAAEKMSYVDFRNWVGKKLEEGWEINSCYEAGARSAGGQKLGGGAQGHGSGRPEAKD